jgi:hypothetical protein
MTTVLLLILNLLLSIINLPMLRSVITVTALEYETAIVHVEITVLDKSHVHDLVALVTSKTIVSPVVGMLSPDQLELSEALLVIPPPSQVRTTASSGI